MKEQNNNKEIKNEERIFLFLTGKMSEVENNEFKTELQSNKELREQAIVLARLIKGMKQADENLVNAFRNSSEKTIRQSINGEEKLHYINIKQWFTIAASLIILFTAGYKIYDYRHITSLGDKYAYNFPIPEITRGSDTMPEELKLLFSNIDNEVNISQSVIQLENLWNESQKDSYNQFTDFSPYIGWYLTIGYLKNYEKQKAITLLYDMKKMYPKDSAIGNKINELLEELE